MKLPAQQVCDILNANKDVKGFCEAMRGRVPVTEEVARDTDVSCSVIEGGFDSSFLGFLNLLVDKPVCGVIGDSGEILRFSLVDGERIKFTEEWDKYEKDVEDYNEANEMDIKPEPRPSLKDAGLEK